MEGPVVFHASAKGALRRRLDRRHGLLVGIRGDRREPLMADLEVVQNGCFANGRTRVYIPHWPQPGLVPRDPARGNRLERVAYKGNLENLHPDFRDTAWSAFLAEGGMVWSADAVDCRRLDRGEASVDWTDYSAVDRLVAIRPAHRRLHRSKLASKRVNAWAVGVPILLGPEAASRALRRSELDYLECSTPMEARESVFRLKHQPGLYRAMVENGLRRAQDITREAVAAP